MKPLKLKEIVAAVGGICKRDIPDIDICNICTDSRDVKRGSLFVALVGENFDGHMFVNQAIENGAAYAVVSKEDDYESENIIYVRTTRQAFLDIAGLYRSKFSPKVVAVTGSVGKTTTREMIAAVVGSNYSLLKTENNLNNEVGVPKTILDLSDDIEAMVLEFGMVHLGEIRELTLPAKPDVAVITCIGTCHIENLGSRENIKKAKFEIIEGLKPGGTLLLNKDNDMLKDVSLPQYNVIFYALDDDTADIRAENIDEHEEYTEFDIISILGKYHAHIPCIGKHNVLNALAGFGSGIALGMDPQQCAKALSNFHATGMRQKLVEYKKVKIYEDCYNANPDSVKAAMETLQSLKADGKKIAVLGDMLELGNVSEQCHIEAGMEAAKAADVLLTSGKMGELISDGAKKAGLAESFHFETKDELSKFLIEIANPGDVVWIKASRGMKFESIAESFYES